MCAGPPSNLGLFINMPHQKRPMQTHTNGPHLDISFPLSLILNSLFSHTCSNIPWWAFWTLKYLCHLQVYMFRAMWEFAQSREILRLCGMYMYHYTIKQVVIEHNMLISTNPPWSVLFPVHVFHHKSHRTHSVNGTVSEHTPCTVEQRKYHSFTANVVTVTVSNVRTDLNQGDGIKLGHAHITLFLEPQSTIQFTDSIKLCHLS